MTSADKATQAYLVKEISRRFPDHGILGEEDSTEGETDDPAPDFLWVLDPLDGTTNFLNGLPLYASSIGVLYRGWPLVGALYLPWPNPKGGFVLHCRRGGGCFADGKPVSVFQAKDPAVAKAGQPVANRLIGLPGYFAQGMKFSKQIKGSPGELRTTGSIAYELGMTACGVLQYAVIGAPKLWDMLAGVLAVQEAGGTVMIRLPGEKGRNPMGSLVPSWEERPLICLENFMPGYFAQGMKFSKQIKGSPGELRTTGSIAYELGMTACGVLQYAVFGAPKLWDMLAGVLAVQEAGGTVMIRPPGEKGRNPMGSLVPNWEERPPSLKQLRGRVWPLVAGNRQLAPLISGSMRRRFRPLAQLKRLWRKVGSHLKMPP